MISNELLKNIKVVVSDVDGTLLNDNGELGLESKRLIRELINKDVVFCLATGRLHSAVTDLASELSLNGYIISLDGAVITDYKSDKTIFESFLKSGHVRKAISIAENLLIKIVLCQKSSIYYTENNSLIPELLSKYGASYKQVKSYEDYHQGTLEIVCASDIKDSIKYMEERFNFPHCIECSTSYFRSRRNENIFYLEIRKAGSSKGKALQRLLNHLSLKPQQAVVIGDWYNDITMFQSKALKVAVSNAVPELIRIADMVTKRSNNEDGVAEFLEMLLKSKRT